MPYGRSSRTTVSNDDGTVRCCAYVDGSLVGHDICKEQDVAAAVVAHLREKANEDPAIGTSESK
jgi:hypothetical protein